MPSITFSDFSRMTGDYEPAVLRQLPDGSWGNGGNLYRSLANVIPAAASLLSYVSGSTSLLDQFAGEPHPLAVTRNPSNVNQSALDAAPVAMVPSSKLGNVALVTRSLGVYALDPSQTNMGNPVSASNQTFADIEMYNGRVFVSWSSAGGSSVYYATPASSASWSAVTGTTAGSSCVHYLRAFGDKLYLTDANASSADRRLVRSIDTSLTMSSGLDLGADWFIHGLTNYDNKYLAVFASRAQNSFGQDQSCLFLWNGQAGSSYDYAVTFTGVYGGSYCSNGTLYLAANDGPDLKFYVLDGLKLRLLRRFKTMTAPSVLEENPKSNLAYANGYLLCVVRSPLGENYGVLAYGPDADESFMLLATPTSQDTFTKVHASVDATNRAQNIYLYREELAGGPNVKAFYPGNNGPTTFTAVPPSFSSNVVEIPEGRAKLESIELWYSSPPPGASDSIVATLSYRDDYDDATDYGSSTFLTATPIDFTSATAGERYSRRDGLGFTCSKLKLSVQVNVSTSSWKPVVYRAKVNYSVVKYQK